MSFKVTIGREVTDSGDVVSGEIFQEVIFAFNQELEKCLLPLNYWVFSDYLKQWKNAAAVLGKQSKTVALVTSIEPLKQAHNIVAWVLYPMLDGTVKIQQRFFPQQNVIVEKSDFDYSIISKRDEYNEYGQAISEWTANICNIVDTINLL